MSSYSENEMLTLLYIFEASNSLELFSYFEEHFLPKIIENKMEDNYENVFKLATVLVKH